MKRFFKTLVLVSLLAVVLLSVASCDLIKGNTDEQETTVAHDHVIVTDEAVAPTCTETGLTEGSHCSVCNDVLVAQEVVDALGHSYEAVVTAPTCTEAGYTTYTCACGDTYVGDDVVALGHTIAVDAAVAPTCTATGLTEGSHCSVCGEVFAAQEVIAALGHTVVVDAAVAPTCTEAGLSEGSHCSVCNEVLVAQEVVAALGHTEEAIPAVAPTCTATGLTAGVKCSACNEVLVAQEEVAALGHTDSYVCGVCGENLVLTIDEVLEIGMSYDKAKYSNEYYWVQLTLDHQVNPNGFARATIAEGLYITVAGGYLTGNTEGSILLGDTVIFKAKLGAANSALTTGGKEVRLYEVAYFEVITNHSHVYQAVVTAPTCTAAGYTTYTCSICGDSYVADEVVALDHTYGTAIIAPTCTVAGYTTYTCSACGDSYVADEVAALGHTAVVDTAVAPTCIATGLSEGSHCSVCNEVLVAQEIVDALGHTEETISAVAPTCTATGLTAGVKCSVCGEIIEAQEEVAALGHTWGNWIIDKAATEEEDGLQHKVCEACGDIVEEIIPALSHEHSYTTVVTAPTCIAGGYTTYTCRCGDSYVADEVPATGVHNTDSYECSVCGKSFILSIEEVLEIGMAYDKTKYSTEYYWVQLTLDNQVNANGFARAKIADGLYITVAGPYAFNYVQGTIQQGDIVIFKAKLGAANSAMTTGGKEVRLYEVASAEVIGHDHVFGTTIVEVLTAPTCGAEGVGYVACACGEKTEAPIPATGNHTISENSYACSVCGKSSILTIDEVLTIGMSYEKGKYSSEYYWVQLTLDHQVNANGFARMTVSNGVYITVAGGYLTGASEGAIKLGDTVIFKAKLGAVNSAMTTGGKEVRLYEVAFYEVIPYHVHSFGGNITVIIPATCGSAGKGTVSCSCGETQEVVIPQSNSAHTPNDDFNCSVCGQSLLISVEEAIKIGMTYEKNTYSTEYYYVKLTLDDQVNPNGFARAYISDGVYFSVAGGYLTGAAEGTIKQGDTVIFKAKIGAVNSAVAVGGKEPRLFAVADFKIVESGGVDNSVSLDGKTDILTYHSSYVGFAEVDKAPAGVTFAFGYVYTKKSGNAAIEKSALVWNTNGKYRTVSFDLYIDKVFDVNGADKAEVELVLSKGIYFVSVVDADGKEIAAVYQDNPYVVLQKGQSYRIVVHVNDAIRPEFYFGLNNKTCEVYFYNVSIEESQYEYVIDSAEQTIVCKKDGETYGYFAWPTVTKLGDGRLMAVASGMRSAHTGMDGKLVCWYSEDEGKTWSEPQLLVDTLLDDRDAGVVYWNGKIIVSWFCASQAYYNGTSIDEAYDTKYMGGNYIISEDGGKTWSEIYCMPEGMFTPHGLILNPDGGLTSVGYLKYDKAQRRWGTGIAVRTTTGEMDENGFIWSEAIVIADSDTQYSWDFQEPYGIYNDDGVLIVVMRSDKGLYQCELQPGETEFSAWHLIAFVQETPAHMMQHSSGVMIMTYGYRGIYVDPVTGKTVSYSERNKDGTLGIRARFSYDGGLTWTQEVILSYGLMPASNSSDWGYTSSVELSDGKILTLFYQRTGSETKASIYQIVWEVPTAPTGEVTITILGGKDADDAKIATVKGNVGDAILLPANPTLPGYTFAGWYLDREYKIPFTATTFSNDLVVYAKWTVNAEKNISVMSFNLKTGNSSSNGSLVINTILDNAPDIFGVQEADSGWINKLTSQFSSTYTKIGEYRGTNSLFEGNESNAIFFRTDLFNLIASGTKWLSNTPDQKSLYSYTENGTTYKANYNRIMTYVVLERKSDGARFIYVNTHLDNNGNNSGTVAENIRKGQVEVLLAQVQKLCNTYGDLPVVVTGDFNTQGVANNTVSYNAMLAGGFVDASKVAKEGAAKTTFTDMSNENSGVIFDYVFVSSGLTNKVQTYKVCDAKRDGKWISDHNAIVANITIAQ